MSKSAMNFFLLVFALSIPFWLIGSLTAFQLLPGLPMSSLEFLCPSAAAVILVYQEHKSKGVIDLLKRAFDYRRIGSKAWYAPILLLSPAVMAMSYGLMRFMGTPLPIPRVAILALLAMFVIFFIAALGEELGWSGYITDPIQERWGTLQAGVLLGFVWAVWHCIPLLQAHRSWTWIAWWSLFTVAARVIIVWLYNNTGRSVFATTLFHTTINVTYFAFPIYGSYYDPRTTGLIMASAAVIVTVVRGPRTLA